jgi:hypothetical protein
MNNQDIQWIEHLITSTVMTLRDELEKKKASLISQPQGVAIKLTKTDRVLRCLRKGPQCLAQFYASLSHDTAAQELHEILDALEKKSLIHKTIEGDGKRRKFVWRLGKEISEVKKPLKPPRKGMETIISEQLATGPKFFYDMRHLFTYSERATFIDCLAALEARGEIVKTYKCRPGSKRASLQYKATKKPNTQKTHFKTYTLGA